MRTGPWTCFTPWFHLPGSVKIPFVELKKRSPFFISLFSLQHHMFLFKPKHGPVVAECHRPAGSSIQPVNVAALTFFDLLFWQPLCLGNRVDFAVRVCVCGEDFVITLHAWCLHLACPSLSPLLLWSPSPRHVDVSAYFPGLSLSLSRGLSVIYTPRTPSGTVSRVVVLPLVIKLSCLVELLVITYRRRRSNVSCFVVSGFLFVPVPACSLSELQ